MNGIIENINGFSETALCSVPNGQQNVFGVVQIMGSWVESPALVLN
jgi:hypothetical protein